MSMNNQTELKPLLLFFRTP